MRIENLGAEPQRAVRSQMNILVVEKTFPWPEVSGSSIRVANLVRALATLGEVDFFLITKNQVRRQLLPPQGEPVSRLGAVHRPPSGYRGLARLGWLAAGDLPVELAMRDYSEVRECFLAWARPRYDLAWFGRADGYVALADLVKAPTVVDLYDLKDQRIMRESQIIRKAAPSDDGAPRTPEAAVRRWGSILRDGVNARRWRALHHRIADSVQAITVCSLVDQERLGAPNGVVIPNGYVPPARPAGRLDVRQPPTLVFPALFRYGPNVDAARFFVLNVLPQIRARLPGLRARLVGQYDHRIEDLRLVEDVTLTGFVPDIVPELARADAIVVPVRFGSGTRVKILEAFAHRIPVVSTSFGCEGLDVENRRHLLVADDPQAFASACLDILGDPELRARLTEEAHELYRRYYRWDVIGSTVAALATRVAQAVTGPTVASNPTD